MTSVLTGHDFKKKHISRNELIKIAENNDGICIEDMNYTISYIPLSDKFKIEYTNPDIGTCIVDYFYILDHFR